MNMPQWLNATIHQSGKSSPEEAKSGNTERGNKKREHRKALSSKGFRKLFPLFPLFPPKNSHPRKRSQASLWRGALSLRPAILPPASSPRW